MSFKINYISDKKIKILICYIYEYEIKNKLNKMELKRLSTYLVRKKYSYPTPPQISYANCYNLNVLHVCSGNMKINSRKKSFRVSSWNKSIVLSL